MSIQFDQPAPPIPTPTDGPETPEAETPRRGSLKKLAMRGAAWTVAERVVSQTLRLVSNLVLSRLLFPEAFGISAAVAVYQQALTMLTDLGVGPSVIQNKDGAEPRFLNTAWTLQVVRGLAMGAVAAILAWPMAVLWFRKPELAPMLAVTALTMVFKGFTPAKQMLATRNMALGLLTRRNLISQVIGLAITAGLAFWLRSAWALVLGGVCGSAVGLVLSQVSFPGPPSRFCWDREAASRIVRFGRWVFVTTLLTFLANQGDRFLMGRYLGEASFGLYNIAFTLCAIPSLTVVMLGPRVVFPALSRVEPERLPAVYDRVCRMLYLGALPAIGLLIGAAPLAIDLLYDPRYHGAGWMARWLGFRAATECLAGPGLTVLLAKGHSNYQAASQAVRAAALVGGVPLAFHAYGMEGAVAVAGFGGLGSVAMVQWFLWRRGLFRPSREAFGVALLIVGVIAGLGLDRVLGPFLR